MELSFIVVHSKVKRLNPSPPPKKIFWSQKIKSSNEIAKIGNGYTVPKGDVLSFNNNYYVFVSSCLCLICICLRMLVSDMYCVFVLIFFVLFALCCLFLWVVHFWLPLRCSLTFIRNCQNCHQQNIYCITCHVPLQ